LAASATENPDLFWAIRGGGSNFGVCTEFVLKLHLQRRNVFSGIIAYPIDKIEALTVPLRQWWESGPSENSALLHIITVTPEGIVSLYNPCSQSYLMHAQPCVMFTLFYNGSEDEGKAYYQPFFDLSK
jgi:hypothetical protein